MAMSNERFNEILKQKFDFGRYVELDSDNKVNNFDPYTGQEVPEEIKKIGILAVAYMPTRNTPAQLERVMKLCRENDLFEISGEDVNSPRQIFACKALAEPSYAHLIDSTWALIGHEAISSEKGLDYGMFSETTIKNIPNLQDRIKEFANIGRKTVK